MTSKAIAYILIGIFAGPIFAIFTTPLAGLLRTIFYVPFIRKKLLEKAISEGHVIEAVYEKGYDMHENNIATMKRVGVYSYQYKNKKRKYRMVTTGRLPETIKLYYIKRPGKATVGGDLGNWEIPWLKIYVSMTLVCAAATVIFGFVTGWKI